ncbi:MAG: DUF6089 family protein [Capnocytophaga sp.]|nr:DUF6089 family protein [Capnocytophaga sp.]
MYIRIFIISLLIIGGQAATAQIHELGVFVGGSNPISDVGRTYYVYPNKLALGALYKWNFHERMSLRAQVTKTTLAANDIDSDIAGKRNRQFHFTNELTELAVGAEYNFFEYSMHNRLDRPYTPYLFTGISYFWYDDLYFDRNVAARPLGATATLRRNKSFAIPLVLGVKAKVSMRLVAAFEVGTRFTFINNLDGSLPDDLSFTFGNKTSNDWYTFTGFTLTYTFGEKPCYCN